MQGDVSCQLPNIVCTLTLLTPNGGDGKGHCGVADTDTHVRTRTKMLSVVTISARFYDIVDSVSVSEVVSTEQNGKIKSIERVPAPSQPTTRRRSARPRPHFITYLLEPVKSLG